MDAQYVRAQIDSKKHKRHRLKWSNGRKKKDYEHGRDDELKKVYKE